MQLVTGALIILAGAVLIAPMKEAAILGAIYSIAGWLMITFNWNKTRN